MTAESLAAKLRQIKGLDVRESDYAKTRCTLDVVAEKEAVRDFALAVREAGYLIESVTGVDANPMMVVYHFTNIHEVSRVTGKVLVDREDKNCPTIEDIYPGANWHERETRDFFGITFTGHPDMTPLILPEEETDFHPLLKGEGKLKNLGELLERFAAPKKEAEVSE
ncbi:NADH-quinone oxidoreductase subunit C [bacterium]|nr:MAG: NADH-quinone oxidoreductase subunit C [bacterium]